MSQVVNLDPESNPKLKEIFDILLLAGYFRIRIPSITPLDKILGGLSWCITQSNFSIDIEFSDEFNIGQKIKVSEKIVSSLQSMQCPYQLSPHQIQGLDLNALYPIVQWLIKFVLETREFRQDQNKRVTKLVGRNAFQALQENDLQERQAIREIVNQLDLIKDTRHTKNMQMASHGKRDPLRVYSALMEYGDLSSQRTYNKLCAIVSGVNEQSKKGGSQSKEKQQQPLSIGQMLFQDGKVSEQNVFSGMQKITVENIENINNQRIQQVQQQIQEMSKTTQQKEEEQLEQSNFTRMERRRNSIAGQNIQRAIENQKEKISESMKKKEEEEDEMLSLASRLKQEKELNEQQIEFQKQNILNFDIKLQELENELIEMKEQEEELEKNRELLQQEKKKMDETINTIQQKSKKIRVSEQQIKQAEELVQRRNELKEERSQLKKQIKEELRNLEKDREIAEKDLPQEEEIAQIQEYKEEYNRKKEKYDKKFTQFSQLNQELMVLQRKIDNIPSASEIAQYHQRFIELYDSINFEMEEYKKYKQFIIYNNSQDVKRLVQQFVDIIRTFKENYQGNLKDKKGKQELVNNLNTTYQQLQANLKRFEDVVLNQKSKRDKNQEEYINLIHLEREYYRLLKQIKLEYDKNELLVPSQQ